MSVVAEDHAGNAYSIGAETDPWPPKTGPHQYQPLFEEELLEQEELGQSGIEEVRVRYKEQGCHHKEGELPRLQLSTVERYQRQVAVAEAPTTGPQENAVQQNKPAVHNGTSSPDHVNRDDGIEHNEGGMSTLGGEMVKERDHPHREALGPHQYHLGMDQWFYRYSYRFLFYIQDELCNNGY